MQKLRRDVQKSDNGFLNAIKEQLIGELKGYSQIKREVKCEESRLDIQLAEEGKELCYVEVKTVTLLGEDGVCRFPDAVSVRGQKHLETLIRLKAEGHRAVLFFLVLREDAQSFRPADDIDPAYGKLLREAADAGVEILVYRATCSPKEILVEHPIPLSLEAAEPLPV